MYRIKNKNSLVVSTVLTFVIITTCTVTIEQEVFGGLFDGGGISIPPTNEILDTEDVYIPPTNEVWEKTKDTAGNIWEDIKDNVKGTTEFNEEKQFTIPPTASTPALPGTLELRGNLFEIEDMDVDLTIVGLKPKNIKLGNDYATIDAEFEGSVDDMIRDITRGMINPDKLKDLIRDELEVEIKDILLLKLYVEIGLPFPQSLNDISQIIVMEPEVKSVLLEGCYNRISNNLPDVEEVKNLDDLEEVAMELEEISNDRNKAINQEYICNKIFET